MSILETVCSSLQLHSHSRFFDSGLVQDLVGIIFMCMHSVKAQKMLTKGRLCRVWTIKHHYFIADDSVFCIILFLYTSGRTAGDQNQQ